MLRLWRPALVLVFTLLFPLSSTVHAAGPNISSLSPTSGAVGASVTINGSNFGSTQGGSKVTFNGAAATPTSWTATKIIAPVPANATTGNVVVTVSGVASNGKSFTVKPTPTITIVSPTFGAVGILVTISGTNFGPSQGSSTVKFNGTAATPKSWSASQITVPVPSGATSGNVVVFTSGVNVNGGTFTVETLTSITVAPTNIPLPLKSVQQYVATANYGDGSHQNLGANATWSSSNISTATVTTAGIVTAVGEGQTTIQATFGSVNGSSTLTVGAPSFVSVGDLVTGRWGHTATLVQSGKVLIVGGEDIGFNMLASAELYDPTTGSFSPTGSLSTPRENHTATLLQNGQVLIAGGDNNQNGGQSLNSAELYNPATGTFAYGGTMVTDHDYHTATLLQSGKVLIAGGIYFGNAGGGDSDNEVYDPSTSFFTATGNMVTPRSSHTATLLNDGTALIAGGFSRDTDSILNSAEIFNPASGTFSATGSMNSASEHHTATLLNTGKALIAGGLAAGSAVLTRAETYDPVAKTFTTVGNMAVPRDSHTATLLSNGTVLLVAGQTRNAVTGTAELYGTSTPPFTGAGALTEPRSAHTATLLNDGTVLIVGGLNGNALSGAELYAPAPPPATSLQVTPSTVNMTVGATQQFTAVDNLGHPRSGATWSVSNPNLATITSDSSPLLTATATGQVTLTATLGTLSTQAQITIYAVGTITPGTPLWSMPSPAGFAPLQLAQALPSDAGSPDLYSIGLSGDGTKSLIQALTIDGQQLWQESLAALNNTSVPDAFGGLLVVENQTCKQGQTEPMDILDLDPTSGQPLWQITAQGIPNGPSTLYCYPDAPQMAVRGDGAIVISAPGNTSGLPEIVVVDGVSGNPIFTPGIPTSSYTNPDGSITQGYSPIGPPMVDSDGAAYVEYEVRTIAYPPAITSAAVYLLKIGTDNSTTTTQLSSTTANQNLFPERIIPDGQGGVLATWVIEPSAGPIPANPYQAAHVVSATVAAAYSLPFTPQNFVVGPDGLPVNPSLVLGENGIVFATDGRSTGDRTNPNLGAKIVSFNAASGAVNWSYQVQVTPPTVLFLIASASGGGVAGKSTISSTDTVLRFDSSGNATPDSWTGTAISNFGGDFWLGYPATGPADYNAAPVELASSPFRAPQGRGNNAAAQNISVTNFSQTGPNQTTISNVFQKIQTALPSYSSCNGWFVGSGANQGTSGSSEIQQLLQFNLFGHATVNKGGHIDYENWAFKGGANPDRSPVPGLPSGIAVTVNDVGGFFNANWPIAPPYNGRPYQLGPRNYGGNTLRAQALTLIHEVAHLITVAGFQDDFGDEQAEIANNIRVVTNCRQLIEGLR